MAGFKLINYSSKLKLADGRFFRQYSICHRLLKRVCVLLSSCEMGEAVIICSLLNFYLGGQNCQRRTLLPGQNCPGGQILGETKMPQHRQSDCPPPKYLKDINIYMYMYDNNNHTCNSQNTAQLARFCRNRKSVGKASITDIVLRVS